MTEPSSPNDHDLRAPEAVPPAPRFRLVDERGPAEGHRPPSGGPPWAGVSRRLLIAGDDWAAHWPEEIDGFVRVRAHIPLIASLARIRSDADAALALATVIESLFKAEAVQLPCGALGESEIGLVVPEETDFAQIAESIDESLAGQVRATDLQGPLRDRSKARVEAY
ncbi:MAG: hypothetical protein AAF726_00085 [Planctomycetota bacterium]